MTEIKATYYKGDFRSQFQSESFVDSKGFKSAVIRLEPRYYLEVKEEITLEEYEEAKKNRLSKASMQWQEKFHLHHSKEQSQDAIPTGEQQFIRPHILQTETCEIELEWKRGVARREICSELYVEFEPSKSNQQYSGWDFIMPAEGVVQGKIQGTGYVRIPILTEEEKRKTWEGLFLKRKLNKGCGNPTVNKLYGAYMNQNSGCRSLFPGIGINAGCMRGGCGKMGCGLLSLLLGLLLLMALWKSCNKNLQDNGGQRVIHDTVYVDEKTKEDVIKRFKDTTTISKTEAIELPNVQFYTNSAKLLPYSIKSIQELADYLNNHQNVHAVIEGHTDNVGEDQSNLQLSQARAETVRNVLISFGVDASRVEAKGYGERRPRASNETMEGRALNRRVEVVLTNTETSETKSTEIQDE